MEQSRSTSTAWWKSAVIYQIYPRSFQDSNGDGIGDLPGITQRLPYLQWLGVDAVWISPFFRSPMKDFGYDISEYCDVDPIFGTLKDAEELIARAHELGIKVIFDYVPNHSSSEHLWFKESRASLENPKRDWYVWRDPKPDGSPPNNWLSRFDGKSAWEFDQHTGQYYLHSFLKEQPDLNWRNDELRTQMLEVMHFWFKKGVDGLRVDVAYRALKDPHLRDNPPDSLWHDGLDPANRFIEKYSKNYPDIHILNRWLRGVADQYSERVLLGEMYLSIQDLVKHYGVGDEFHLPYNFNLIYAPWKADSILSLIQTYEALLPQGEWPTWVLGNHDQHRLVSRLGYEKARAAAVLLLTLKGTPTVYYGEELGLPDVEIPPDKIQDPWEKYVTGLGLGRDPERTPMLWSGELHAGFSTTQKACWLPLHHNFQELSVTAQTDDTKSMLSFYRSLLRLRKMNKALSIGEYEFVHTQDDVLTFRRVAGAEWAEVFINFSDRSVAIPIEEKKKSARAFLATAETGSEASTLSANAAVVITGVSQ